MYDLLTALAVAGLLWNCVLLFVAIVCKVNPDVKAGIIRAVQVIAIGSIICSIWSMYV